MSRRVSLPGADELFGANQDLPRQDPSRQDPLRQDSSRQDASAREAPDETGSQSRRRGDEPSRKPSGRVRHDEKITVYVTGDELLDLEYIRLMLRREHGLAVDRGRLVREAIHQAIEDVATHGSNSALLRRLREP
ncbi:MAG: hypothetical protein ACR2KG_04290 [Nocardioidaceae bacterium]